MKFAIILMDTHTYVSNMLFTHPTATRSLWVSETGNADAAIYMTEKMATQMADVIARQLNRPTMLHLNI